MGPENTDQLATTAAKDDEDEWKAAWSDDDDGEEGFDEPMKGDSTDENDDEAENSKLSATSTTKKREFPGSRILKSSQTKKRKISHHRSRLATLLSQCSENSLDDNGRRFTEVTDHIASLGPSAIDVSLSSLCNGMHDLDEGLPLLKMACSWLIEGCESRERYEAMNAYLHRFLHIHATVIAGVEDDTWKSDEKDKSMTPEELEELEQQEEEREELIELISQLRRAQQSAMNHLNGQLQSSLCLLRHFSRMV